jgi:hypothetical protein
MLCQKCHQRPATVTIKQTVSGKQRAINLCYICAEEQSLFSQDSFSNSIFDSLFDLASPLERSNLDSGRTQPERINIIDYFSERAKNIIAESIEIAKEFKSNYIDTEHLLLGLLEEEEVAVKILEELKIYPHDFRQYLDQNIY